LVGIKKLGSIVYGFKTKVFSPFSVLENGYLKVIAMKKKILKTIGIPVTLIGSGSFLASSNILTIIITYIFLIILILLLFFLITSKRFLMLLKTISRLFFANRL
jgi:hypothetical protein